MKIHIVGKKPITLKSDAFISKGGQGSTYKQGNTVYKIFNEQQYVVPEKRINELQVLDKPNIIKPVDMVYDDAACRNPIGFSMNSVNDAHSATALITTRFQEMNNIKPDDLYNLIAQMRDTYGFIHSKKCLVVDGSDRNFLIKLKGMVPYFIDVDSYQSPNYRAEFITPSIIDYLHDPTCKKFTVHNDYYSFSILCCLLLLGIHPYKGHFKNFSNNSVAERAKAKKSIFNPDAQLPSSVRDFGAVPASYMQWFIDTFEKGLRNPPPDSFAVGATYKPTLTIVQAMNKFKATLIKTRTTGNIKFYGTIGIPYTVIKTSDALYVNDTPYPYDEVFIDRNISPPQMVFVDRKNKKLMSSAGEVLNDSFEFEDFFIYDNTFYYTSSGKLNTVSVHMLANKVAVIPSRSPLGIMPNSSQVFSGVVITSMLGRAYAIVPVENTPGSYRTYKVPEFDEHRFIDARYCKDVLMTLTEHKNKALLSVLKLDSAGYAYVLQSSEEITVPSINFVVKDKGLVVHIVEDGKLRMFSNKYNENKMMEIQDPGILSVMKLFTDGDNIMMSNKDKLYKLEMVK